MISPPADPGYGAIPGAFSPMEAARLIGLIPSLNGQAGTRRLLDHSWCWELAGDPRVAQLVASILGSNARPIRAILFDKAPGRNWNLGWHQDTKIALRQARPQTPGYSGWTTKEGCAHALPPVQVLESCVAVRIHLDDCPSENGPLQVIPGSHLLGIRPEPTEEEVRRAVTLTASQGDVIWMRPLVFHGSPKAEKAGHRRVIHIEFSSAELPEGLDWAWQAPPG